MRYQTLHKSCLIVFGLEPVSISFSAWLRAELLFRVRVHFSYMTRRAMYLKMSAALSILGGKSLPGLFVRTLRCCQRPVQHVSRLDPLNPNPIYQSFFFLSVFN